MRILYLITEHTDFLVLKPYAGQAMTENKIIIPIWKKSNLTVEEAAAYCGIGSRKLREMSDSEFCPFVLWNGSKRLIKRRKLDEYLDNAYSI